MFSFHFPGRGSFSLEHGWIHFVCIFASLKIYICTLKEICKYWAPASKVNYENGGNFEKNYANFLQRNMNYSRNQSWGKTKIIFVIFDNNCYAGKCNKLLMPRCDDAFCYNFFCQFWYFCHFNMYALLSGVAGCSRQKKDCFSSEFKCMWGASQRFFLTQSSS